MRPNHSFTLLAICLLSACAGKQQQRSALDNEPTLRTLVGRPVVIDVDHGLVADEGQAIAAYRKFLDAAPKASQRAEAMRRIGDLEMDRADLQAASPQAAGDPDYKAAIQRYQEFLKVYPTDSNNDRVLYQLARAQEQSGNLESALKTLDRLVLEYPSTSYFEEAHFRRGELLFTARDYPTAEKAYATVLGSGTEGRYHDRALYMQGWSRYKQGKLETALASFFGVLDLKLLVQPDATNTDTSTSMGRADKELVEDTFRVTSLSLANLQGADSIGAYTSTENRRGYESRVYEQLGELYLKQERVKDAADTFGLFARLRPLDAQAPILQARVIDIYANNGFATLALEAKKDYVNRYGGSSAFRTANQTGWENAQGLVKTHMAELARHYHASAQKSKTSSDYQEAAHWYREYLQAFPTDPRNAQTNFLLAELLYEDNQFAQATAEYEKTAYGYPAHEQSADAGYAALLGYTQQLKKVAPAEVQALQRTSVASALRFAQAFSKDARAAPVLSDAAEKLYALKDNDQAAVVAQQVIDLQPSAALAQRRVAWTVLAFTAFEAGAFERSETAFAELLKVTPANDPARTDFVERQAAAIYKQGELARSAGQTAAAVAHFERVGKVAPQSSARAAAQYDAAALRIALKDWNGAAQALEDFRQRYPSHPLQAQLGSKLALVYLEKGHWAQAATEFEKLAATNNDPVVARDALWQAAELYQKADSRSAATRAYERYLVRNPQPLGPALEARFRLAKMASDEGNTTRELALMKEIFQADQAAGAERSERSRYLGATAALALAEPVAQTYRKIALTEPLQKQLKLKKARMEDALKAYALATDYGVADVTTAATYRIAMVYQDFGRALIGSERPKKLNKLEREQYNVLLEEQAYPFEEKATEIHETNARRAATGIYDQWVKKSFEALRELRPVRYGKTERGESMVEANPKLPGYLNQQGIAYRQSGQFDKAREAYQKAITIDANYATAILNYGILCDLYLGDLQCALDQYGRYLALAPAGDTAVTKWITELKGRKPALASVPTSVAAKEKT